jgi:hypothetical protein
MCARLNEKIAAHEESTRRELGASQRAADELTATLHLHLARLHQQQAESLRDIPLSNHLGVP